jgi:RNA polymerase-binding transcription factor DksA
MAMQAVAKGTLEQNQVDRRSAWRIRLLENRNFRLQQIGELTAELEVGQPPAHEQITMQLLTAARLSLRETNDALARLVSGRFGICTRCRKSIEAERLDALPMAPLCMSCQYQAEIGRTGSRSASVGLR